MFQMFLYYDVDGIVPDMLQLSAAMMDFIMDTKMCQNDKNSKLDIFIVPTLGVKVLCFFEVK